MNNKPIDKKQLTIETIVKYFSNEYQQRTLDTYKQKYDISHLSEEQIVSKFITQQFANNDLPYIAKIEFENNHLKIEVKNGINNQLVFKTTEDMTYKKEKTIKNTIQSLMLGDIENENNNISKKHNQKGLFHALMKDQFSKFQQLKNFTTIQNIDDVNNDFLILDKATIKNDWDIFTILKVNSHDVISELIKESMYQNEKFNYISLAQINEIVNTLSDRSYFEFALENNKIIATSIENPKEHIALGDLLDKNELALHLQQFHKNVENLILNNVDEIELSRKANLLLLLATKLGNDDFYTISDEYVGSLNNYDFNDENDMEDYSNALNQQLQYELQNVGLHDVNLFIKVTSDSEDLINIQLFKDNNIIYENIIDVNDDNAAQQIIEFTGKTINARIFDFSKSVDEEFYLDRTEKNFNRSLLEFPIMQLSKLYATDRNLKDNNIFEIISQEFCKKFGIDLTQESSKMFEKIIPTNITYSNELSKLQETYGDTNQYIQNRILQKASFALSYSLSKHIEYENSFQEWSDEEMQLASKFNQGKLSNGKTFELSVNNNSIMMTITNPNSNIDHHKYIHANNIEDLTIEYIKLYNEERKLQLDLNKKTASTPKPN